MEISTSTKILLAFVVLLALRHFGLTSVNRSTSWLGRLEDDPPKSAAKLATRQHSVRSMQLTPPGGPGTSPATEPAAPQPAAPATPPPQVPATEPSATPSETPAPATPATAPNPPKGKPSAGTSTKPTVNQAQDSQPQNSATADQTTSLSDSTSTGSGTAAGGTNTGSGSGSGGSTSGGSGGLNMPGGFGGGIPSWGGQQYNPYAGSIAGHGFGGGNPYNVWQPGLMPPWQQGFDNGYDRRPALEQDVPPREQPRTLAESPVTTAEEEPEQRSAIPNIGGEGVVDGTRKSSERKAAELPRATSIPAETSSATAYAALQILGIDRSGDNGPRLMLVCHESYVQIQLQVDTLHEERLAFNPPPVGELRFLRLPQTWAVSGRCIRVYGLKSGSVDERVWKIVDTAAETSEEISGAPTDLASTPATGTQ